MALSECILVLVPLPAKDASSQTQSRKFEFPITVNKLFNFSAQGSDFALFIGNGTQGKTPSEIKPSLFH